MSDYGNYVRKLIVELAGNETYNVKGGKKKTKTSEKEILTFKDNELNK